MKILNVLLKILEIVIRDTPRLILSVGLILALGFLVKVERDFSAAKKQKDTQIAELLKYKSQYEQLSPTLAQLETQYKAEKELRIQAEKNWAKEKGQLNGQIVALANASFELSGFKKALDHADLVEDGKAATEEIHFYGVGPEFKQGPPFGSVRFDNQGGVIDRTYQARVDINAAVTKDKSGKYHVVAKGSWTLTDPDSLGHSHPELKYTDWFNKPWPLAISGGDFVIDPTVGGIAVSMKPKLRWAPHLNIGSFGGVSGTAVEYGFHGDMNLWGYGLTKNDLDFKFIGVGLNASRGYFDLNVNPISYRIGNWIPLVDDVYLGPGVGFGNHGVNYFLGITTTL